MFSRLILTCLVFVGTAGTYVIQSQPSWSLPVFDGEQILVIDQSGVTETIGVPDELAQTIFTASYNPMILSPDHRYFVAVTVEDPEIFVGITIRIADLLTGECCITLESPIGSGLLDISLGVFDEHNRYFTATIGTVLSDTTRDAMIVVDAQTGKVSYQIDPKMIFDGARFVEFLDWDSSGIHLLPLKEMRAGRGDFIDTNAYIWNLDTNGFVVDANYFAGFYGAGLPSTQEYLYVKAKEDVADSNDESTSVRVIETIVNGDVENSRPILSFPGNDFLPNPHWVLDGQAYLMRGSGHNDIVIFRDGTTIEVPFNEVTQFIAGTPDGWILQQARPPDERTLFYFTLVLDDNAVQITPIMTSDQIVFPLLRPELGKNLEPSGDWIPVRLD